MNIHNISRVVIVSNGHLLLVRARKKDGTPFFFLPGGHIEYGETIEAAAIRELNEEAGIDATRVGPLRLLGVYEYAWDHDGSLYHEIDFVSLCEVGGLSAAMPVASRESGLSFHWQALDALREVNFLPEDFRTLIPEWLENPANPQRFFRSRFL